MKKIKSFMLVLLAFCSLALIGCRKDPDPEPDPTPTPTPEVVYTISLDKTSLELDVNEEATLVATLLADGKACSDAITWTTSNADVASVEGGKVKGLAEGSATIKASAHDVSATATVTVNSVEVFLVLNYSSSTLKVGETLQLSATLTDGSTPTLTYTSSNATVATVSDSGLITATAEGEAIISVSAGEGITATCKIVVDNVYELIFPTIENTNVFVGDVIDLNTVVKVNGAVSTEVVEIEGEGFTLEGDVITITRSGEIVVTVKYGELQFSQTLNSWVKVATVEDFKNIRNDLNAHYKLVNDLDFEGASLEAFSSYKTFNSTDALAFGGTFDGQGHTIYNIAPVANTSNSGDCDIAIFGYMTKTGVVRNVNFIGVIAKDRFSLVSNWCEGTVENVYADITYTSTGANTVNANNPIGSIVAKARPTANITNCVVNLKVANEGVDTANFGTLASYVSSGATFTNCYVVCSNSDLKLASVGSEYIGAGATAYSSVSALISNADFSAFDSTLWTIEENRIPHLGEVTSEVTVEDTELEVYPNANIQLEAVGTNKVYYILKSNVNDVELTEDGLLTVGDVPAGTQVKVLVTDYYIETPVEVIVTVTAAKYTVDDTKYQPINFELIKGISDVADYSKAHNLVVKLTETGEAYVGEEITFVSSNDNVVTVDATNVIAVNDGTATINVLFNGISIYHFDVTVAMWYGISTIEEFEAINTDNTTRSRKYKLLNDLDYNGGTIKTIAHYADDNKATFSGIFDGQGYSIMNYSGVTGKNGTAANASPFGTLSGTVINVNFINGVIAGRIAGGVATQINETGLVENCYVDILITHDTLGSDQNNPIGGIVSKNYGTIRNCVAVVNIKEGINTTNIGGIAGRNYYGTEVIANSYALTIVGITESATPNGTTGNNENSHGTGIDDKSAVYASLAELITVLKADDTFDTNVWTIVDGKYPHLGSVNSTVSASTVEYKIYPNNTLELVASSTVGVYYRLKEEVQNVTVASNGVVTIGNLETETQVLVEAYNMYSDSTVEISILVEIPSYVVDDTNFTAISYELIESVSEASEYVKPHNLVVKYMNEVYTGDEVTFESSNEAVATVDSTNVTAVGDGTATIKVMYGGAPIYSFEVTVVMWNAVTTTEEFKAIGANKESLTRKYKLINDLDFAGEEVAAFSSWATNNSEKKTFAGIFDGQGYTIYNITPVAASGNSDVSLFGYMSAGSVVKNVNFVGVIGHDRFSVVSNWCHGTIENVYVDMEYISTAPANLNANNPAGTIVAKVQAGAVIRNCLVNLRLAEGANTDLLGTFASSVAGGEITNCYVICSNTELPLTRVNPDKIDASTKAFASIEELYAGTDFATYDSSIWTIEAGKLPHVGTVDSSIEVEDINAYKGITTQLTSVSKVEVTYSLQEAVEGVEVTSNGVLSIASTVAADTVIKVVVTNNYGGQAVINVTAKDLPIEVTVDDLAIDYIIGVSENTVAHNAVVKYEGEVYTGSDVTYTSSNETAVTVDATNVTIVGEGIATITISYMGAPVATFTVTVVNYHPVRTTEEFLAIGTDATTMSYKYKLLNDIDFKGATVHALTSYNLRNTKAFTGVFDGQGYSLMNMVITTCADSGAGTDAALFGYITGSTVSIKNLSVIGAEISNVGGVIASWVDNGVIENCYVDVKVTGTTNVKSGNDIGSIAWRVQAKATVRNCISTVTVVDGVDTAYVAGIVGMQLGVMDNCQAIVLSDHTLNAYTSTHSTIPNPPVTNSVVYNGIAAFYESVDTTQYNNLWTFDENKQLLPHLGTVDSTIEVEDVNAYKGITTQLTAVSKVPVTYSLQETVEGVEVTSAGLLSIANTVAADAVIKVVVSNNYGGQAVINVTAKDLPIEVAVDDIEVDYIVGVSETTVAHNAVIKYEGEVYTGTDVTYTSSNEEVATVNTTNVTIVGGGAATITISYMGAPVATFTVTVVEYNPIYTIDELHTINATADARTLNYKLMNNLDYKGGTLITTAHYNDDGSSTAFSGIFDGQGYSIMNYSGMSGKNGTVANCGIFGSIAASGVVRNLNLINGVINGRISGAIASTNKGTIENCFVEVNVTYSGAAVASDYNNPIGGIVSKNNGAINNCVVVLKNVTDSASTFTGAIAGRNVTGVEVIKNCYALSLLGLTESATPTNNYTTDSAGTKISNSKSVSTLEELITALKADSTFASLWTINEGSYPHVGTVNSVIESSVEEVYRGLDNQITTSCNLPLTYSLVETIEGVTLSNTGLLTIDAAVVLDTVINVSIKNNYGGSATVSVTVKELPLEVTSVESITVEECTVGDEQSKVAHNISVKLNGEDYSEGITYKSSNEAIATVDASNVNITGEGTATISILFNGVEVHSFAVTATTVWHPVTTTAEFLAIGTDNTTMSYKYKLMNDLDFEGADIPCFSSYSTRTTITMTGIFDGQGYTISNFTPVVNTTRSTGNDLAIFGYMSAGSVVKNVNFTGVTGTNRFAVVSNMCYGTIENVYLEMEYASTTTSVANVNENNPAGTIVGKLEGSAVVRNCVVKLSLVEDAYTTYFGGIASKIESATVVVENCSLICANTAVNQIGGFKNTTADVTVSNTVTYASVDEFLAGELVSNYTESMLNAINPTTTE